MGKGCHADGAKASQVNEPDPQSEKHHIEDEEAEVENVNDDGQSHVELKVEPKPLNNYPGGSHGMYVLPQYQIHLAYCMFVGVVNFYNLNFLVLCF